MESIVSFLTSKHVNIDASDLALNCCLFETISALQKLNKLLNTKGKMKGFQPPANAKKNILYFCCKKKTWLLVKAEDPSGLYSAILVNRFGVVNICTGKNCTIVWKLDKHSPVGAGREPNVQASFPSKAFSNLAFALETKHINHGLWLAFANDDGEWTCVNAGYLAWIHSDWKGQRQVKEGW